MYLKLSGAILAWIHYPHPMKSRFRRLNILEILLYCIIIGVFLLALLFF
jgi:hypothetical protein